VPIAGIIKPHGLRGEVTIELTTDFPERMTQAEGVLLLGPWGSRRVRVSGVRGLADSRAIVKIEGVDDREQAERLRGGELAVDRSSVPPLPDGEYYDFQIVGLRVVTTDGQDLGRVVEVARVGGGSDLYVTDEVSVPAVDRFVREISLQRGEIVVEGLDELLDE